MQRGLRSMIVKKFYGTNTRDALRQVRDALGPDALILANRQIAGGGVEIIKRKKYYIKTKISQL